MFSACDYSKTPERAYHAGPRRRVSICCASGAAAFTSRTVLRILRRERHSRLAGFPLRLLLLPRYRRVCRAGPRGSDCRREAHPASSLAGPLVRQQRKPDHVRGQLDWTHARRGCSASTLPGDLARSRGCRGPRDALLARLALRRPAATPTPPTSATATTGMSGTGGATGCITSKTTAASAPSSASPPPAAWGPGTQCLAPADRHPHSRGVRWHDKTRKGYDVYLRHDRHPFPRSADAGRLSLLQPVQPGRSPQMRRRALPAAQGPQLGNAVLAAQRLLAGAVLGGDRFAGRAAGGVLCLQEVLCAPCCCHWCGTARR